MKARMLKAMALSLAVMTAMTSAPINPEYLRAVYAEEIAATNSMGETEDNYITRIDVSYIGGLKDIGDAISKNEFKVTGKMKRSGEEVVIPGDYYTITSPTNMAISNKQEDIDITYTNIKGKVLKDSVKVTASKLVSSISVAWKTPDGKATNNFDANDPITKDMIIVKGQMVGKDENGNSIRTLDPSEYTISPERTSSEKVDTTVTVSYTNKLNKTLTKQLTVKSNKVITGISASWAVPDGESQIDFDANDPISKNMIIVKGKLAGKDGSNSTERILDPSEYTITPEKTSSSDLTTDVVINYTNKLNKPLKDTLKAKANKVITKVEFAYNGTAKNIGDKVTAEEFTALGKSALYTDGVAIPASKLIVENGDITAESNKVTVKYINGLGKEIKKTFSIKADLMVDKVTLAADANRAFTVGEEVSASDFTVVGTLLNGSTKPITTGYEIQPTIVSKKNQEFTVLYNNEIGKTLKDTVKVQADNPISDIAAKMKSETKALVEGAAPQAKDFSVTAYYADGSKKTVTDFGISPSVVPADGVFTITYGGKSTTVTSNVDRTASTLRAVLNGNKTYKVGDSVDKADVTAYAVHNDKSESIITDFKLSNNKLKLAGNNEVTVIWKSPSGDEVAYALVVNAADSVSKVSMQAGSGEVDDVIDAGNIDDYVIAAIGMASGAESNVKVANNPNFVLKSGDGTIINSGNGSMTLVEKKSDNKINWTYNSGTGLIKDGTLTIKATVPESKQNDYATGLKAVVNPAGSAVGVVKVEPGDKENSFIVYVANGTNMTTAKAAKVLDIVATMADGNDYTLSNSDYKYTSGNNLAATKSGNYKVTTTENASKKGKGGKALSLSIKINVVTKTDEVAIAGGSSVDKGKTIKLTASGGSGKYTWKSGDTKVLTVKASSDTKTVTITGKKAGSAKITVVDKKNKDNKASKTISVNTGTKSDVSISGSGSVDKGKTIKLTASGGSGKYTWKSSDTKVLSVKASSDTKTVTVKGKKAGSAKVTLIDKKNKDNKASKTITVSTDASENTTIKTFKSLKYNRTDAAAFTQGYSPKASDVTATVVYMNGKTGTVSGTAGTFTSGKVLGAKGKSVTLGLTLNVNGKNKKKTVPVKSKYSAGGSTTGGNTSGKNTASTKKAVTVKSIKLTKLSGTKKITAKGGTLSIGASVVMSDKSVVTKNMTWTSSKPDVVSIISNNGSSVRVEGHKNGSAKITASYGGKSKPITITVSIPKTKTASSGGTEFKSWKGASWPTSSKPSTDNTKASYSTKTSGTLNTKASSVDVVSNGKWGAWKAGVRTKTVKFSATFRVSGTKDKKYTATYTCTEGKNGNKMWRKK